jgi:hypothetical protein
MGPIGGYGDYVEPSTIVKEIPQFMVVEVSNDQWLIVQASYDDTFYTVRSTCTNFDDAKYLCEMLNRDWNAQGMVTV